MAKISLALVLILTLVLVPTLNAGCGHFFHHKVVVAVPVAVAVPVYQVGTDLEIKAAVERAFREREALANQQAFQAQQNQLKAYQQQQWEAERKPPIQQPTQQYPTTAQGTYGNLPQFRQMAPTLFAKCAQCHESVSSSAGATYDMSAGLTGDQFLRVTDMIANKTNLPPQMVKVMDGIKPEEYGKMLDELIKVAKATKSVAPQVVSNPYGY